MWGNILSQILREALILTPGLYGNDGISVVSREIVSAIANSSVNQLEVWSLTDCVATSPYGDCVRIRPAFGNRTRYSLWALQRSLRHNAGTLVIVLHVRLAPVALPLLCRGAGMICFLHGIECWHELPLIQKTTLRQATRLIANSKHTAERFKHVNREFTSHAVSVCHLGLSPTSRKPKSDSWPVFFALIVGRMAAVERYKGHDLLLEIWPKVLVELPHAVLIIVGDGDDRCRLWDKAQSLGLGDAVRFVGEVSDEELSQLYNDCTFFVMPSSNEGFGLVFLEAMRAGKACIGALGSATEIIVDGVTGFIVDPCRPDEVLGSVLRLFRDSGLRKAFGTAGKQRFDSQFTDVSFRTRLLPLLDLKPRTPVCLA